MPYESPSVLASTVLMAWDELISIVPQKSFLKLFRPGLFQLPTTFWPISQHLSNKKTKKERLHESPFIKKLLLLATSKFCRKSIPNTLKVRIAPLH